MTRSHIFGFGLVSALVLAGCGSSGSTDSKAGAEADDNGSPKVAVADANKKFTGSLEVEAFKGGFGIDDYEKSGKEFQDKNPGLTVTVKGDPRIWEKVKNQILAGTPPDLMLPGWGMDHWALAEEGQLATLDAALDSPAADGKTKWRDTFEPTLLKLGQKDGKQYVLPYYFSMLGWWYNPDVFAKNGWKVPTTFDELLKLDGQIKAKGIAPITFQGQYPYYMLDGMLLPWTVSIGGVEAVNDIQNLVPGAWKSPAVLQAVKMIAQLRDAGDFQKGAVGMSHTESQTAFLKGDAAMIPCGTWLYSEMKQVMPPNAKMQFMLPPVVAGAKGDPTAIQIGIEPWMIPAKAKNQEAAIALFKYMTSPEKAKNFVVTKGTLCAIKGSDDVKLPDTLVEPAKIFKASKTPWSYISRQWYPKLEKEVENALTALLNKDITPEKFCERAEEAAEKTRKDDSISKHKL